MCLWSSQTLGGLSPTPGPLTSMYLLTADGPPPLRKWGRLEEEPEIAIILMVYVWLVPSQSQQEEE